MKAIKWIAGIGGGLLVLFVMLGLVLTPITVSRQASLAPLDREALAELGIVVETARDDADVFEDAVASEAAPHDVVQDLTRLAGLPPAGINHGANEALWSQRIGVAVRVWRDDYCYWVTVPVQIPSY